jgi:hypothetical protein
MVQEDRPIWGIHMDAMHGLKPIQDGFVAIGWEAVGDLSKLTMIRNAFEKGTIFLTPLLLEFTGFSS